MKQVTSMLSLPFELREMIWERYKVSSEPMIHVFTHNRIAKEPQLINSYRIISLPMPDMADMKTTRSLLQVSREVRHAILNRHEVLCFSRPLKDIACVYGWKSPSIHDPAPTCCLTSYSSLFVDWEKDVFYFPYPCDVRRPNHIYQNPDFKAKVQHVAFAGEFHRKRLRIFSWFRLPDLLSGIADFTRLFTRNTELPLISTRSLKALQSIRLVVGPFQSQEATSCVSKDLAWRQKITATKSDLYGFCDPRDVGGIFTDIGGHEAPADYWRMEIEVSRKMSATGSPSFISARDTAEQNMTHEAKAEQRSKDVVELRLVVDLLGEWDFEFQGYNRATNLAAPLRFE